MTALRIRFSAAGQQGAKIVSSLTALILSDGLPGHYQRAEGIVAAIQRLRKVEIFRVNVQRRRWLPGRVLAALLRTRLAPAGVLKLAYGIDAATLPRPDLVVSSGGNTLAANAAAARHFKAPNIFYGGLRRFAPDDFSLVLTSYAGHAALPKHRMVPLMPSPLDPDNFPPRHGTVPKVAGLLIGGNAGTFRYLPADWEKLLSFVTRTHEADGMKWIIANSRRTPAAVSDEVARRVKDGSGSIVEFIDVRAAGSETLERFFTEAGVIFCSDDSSSMISEAIWLRRPVIGISPLHARFAEREGWYRGHLIASNWTRSIPIAELSPERARVALREITLLADNPLDALADAIRHSLPQLFDPD